MATTVWALDAASGAPNYTGIMLRNSTVAPFAGVAPVGSPLGVRSGVRPGTPNTTAFLSGASNFTWNVAAHAGIVQAESSTTAGPYSYWTDGTDTGTVNAANATYPRIDILYVQINDTVQDSSGLESGSIGYLAGTAAASPVQPAAPARSMVLATISVPASGGGNPTISWKASAFTDPPLFQGYASAAQNHTSSGNYQAIGLDGVTFNNDGMWVIGYLNRATCVTPGTFEASGQVVFGGSTQGTRRAAGIGINGASTPTWALAELPIQTSSTIGYWLTIPTVKFHLNAGDYVQLLGFQDSGVSAAYQVGANMTFLSIKRIADL